MIFGRRPVVFFRCSHISLFAKNTFLQPGDRHDNSFEAGLPDGKAAKPIIKSTAIRMLVWKWQRTTTGK
jgi:hypothetical protein